MPPKAQVDTVEPIDLLIITAAEAEDDAVREVREGALGDWRKTPGPTGYGFSVWRNEYRAADGGVLTVALTRAVEMGGAGAGNAAGRLVDAYRPRCLAMCGVCAGHPGRVRLGDVIIADRVWRDDEGALVNAEPGGRPVLQPDITTYQINAQWKQAAEQYPVPPDADWLRSRPRPRDMQESWVLNEIHNGRHPLDSPDRERLCADWPEVVTSLRERKLISLKGDRPMLTKLGRERIQEELFTHGNKLPEQEPWKVAVGPLGTGNNLVKDVDIWDRLAGTQQRHVLGLEMEGAVIGFSAHVQNVPYLIVAKGVMDYAEPGRTQGFRRFAARAAAEVLLGFVRSRLDSRPSDILRPNTMAPPQHAANPGTLLNARYQIVRFFEETRRRELDELRSWCEDPAPTGIRLFYGPGGAGKTRLLIEWCARLRDKGWKAGFLPERVAAADLAALTASETRTLVVVDYAEGRPDLLSLLQAVAGRSASNKTPLRVALLSREVGDWWRVLHEQDAAIADLLARHQPLPLQAVTLEGDLRRKVFVEAEAAFAAFRGKPPTSPEVDLRDPLFGRMLYLHMAALAAVEDLPLTVASLLDEIVTHEERYWAKQFAERYTTPLDVEAFRAASRRTVSGLTLLGGVPTGEAAEEVKRRLDGPVEPHFCPFLHWLYPGAADSADSAAQNRYIRALEPDLLGETLVSRVLHDPQTPRAYLTRVFEGAAESAVRNGFIVLSRLALRGEAEATRWIEQVLGADVSGRARAAFDAALALSADTAHAPLGVVLAKALEREGTAEFAAAVESLIPNPTVSLREVGAWVLKRLLHELPADSDDMALLVERTRLLNNLGAMLSELGRREEALRAAQEAAQHYLDLTRQLPEAYSRNLLIAAGNLLKRLEEAGIAPGENETMRQVMEVISNIQKPPS